MSRYADARADRPDRTAPGRGLVRRFAAALPGRELRVDLVPELAHARVAHLARDKLLEYYDAATAKLVTLHYKADLEAFGYAEWDGQSEYRPWEDL